MRIALVAAVSAVCLVLSAGAASAEPSAPDFTPTLALAQTADGPRLGGETWLARPLRLRIEAVATPGGGPRNDAGAPRRLRLAHYTLDYFPFAGGLRLSIGAGRERSNKAALRVFNLRGETTFAGGTGFAGRPRRVAPFAGIGFDRPINADTRFSIDGGVRMGRRDAASSQLLRLAGLGNRGGLLAASGSGFGPLVRVSLMHRF